jgi:hypothetical protein
MSPTAWEDYIESAVASAPATQQPGRRAVLESLPRPEVNPLVRRLDRDLAGNAWLAIHGTGMWVVVDAAGRPLGSLPALTEVTPMQIRADYILGTVPDTMDVEVVVLLPLERGLTAPKPGETVRIRNRSTLLARWIRVGDV